MTAIQAMPAHSTSLGVGRQRYRGGGGGGGRAPNLRRAVIRPSAKAKVPIARVSEDVDDGTLASTAAAAAAAAPDRWPRQGGNASSSAAAAAAALPAEDAGTQFRFEGTRRLYGDDRFDKLTRAHVMVLGRGLHSSTSQLNLSRV
jgi:hypothetical protein